MFSDVMEQIRGGYYSYYSMGSFMMWTRDKNSLRTPPKFVAWNKKTLKNHDLNKRVIVVEETKKKYSILETTDRSERTITISKEKNRWQDLRDGLRKNKTI